MCGLTAAGLLATLPQRPVCATGARRRSASSPAFLHFVAFGEAVEGGGRREFVTTLALESVQRGLCWAGLAGRGGLIAEGCGVL